MVPLNIIAATGSCARTFTSEGPDVAVPLICMPNVLKLKSSVSPSHRSSKSLIWPANFFLIWLNKNLRYPHEVYLRE